MAETIHKEQQLGVNEIVQLLRIYKVTLYIYLRHHGADSNRHRKGNVDV